ncbi:Uncharacterised protein [uncultured archaeon]|nr:Uncharacterised protein [uncultured archaeon]
MAYIEDGVHRKAESKGRSGGFPRVPLLDEGTKARIAARTNPDEIHYLLGVVGNGAVARRLIKKTNKLGAHEEGTDELLRNAIRSKVAERKATGINSKQQ